MELVEHWWNGETDRLGREDVFLHLAADGSWLVTHRYKDHNQSQSHTTSTAARRTQDRAIDPVTANPALPRTTDASIAERVIRSTKPAMAAAARSRS